MSCEIAKGAHDIRVASTGGSFEAVEPAIEGCDLLADIVDLVLKQPQRPIDAACTLGNRIGR